MSATLIIVSDIIFIIFLYHYKTLQNNDYTPANTDFKLL